MFGLVLVWSLLARIATRPESGGGDDGMAQAIRALDVLSTCIPPAELEIALLEGDLELEAEAQSELSRFEREGFQRVGVLRVQGAPAVGLASSAARAYALLWSGSERAPWAELSGDGQRVLRVEAESCPPERLLEDLQTEYARWITRTAEQGGPSREQIEAVAQLRDVQPSEDMFAAIREAWAKRASGST